MEETIEGYIEHIIYRNQENGYTVANLVAEETEITCVGIFQYLNEGEAIRAKGVYKEHPSYGQQFSVSSYEIVIPQDSLAMERYLGSGAIKGIGAALAARIVRHFGDDTLRIIETEPERLAEVKGISERKAREIAEQVEDKADMRKAMMFLQQYGISQTLGAKIYQQYKQDMYRILKENPYKMAEDISGVGFKIADEIAARIGIHTDSDYRIRSGLLYILLLATAEGHVYLPKRVLLARAEKLLGVQADYMEKHIVDLAIDRKIVVKEITDDFTDEKEQVVYASQYYQIELHTAQMLHELNLKDTVDEEVIAEKIRRIQKAEKIELDEMQQQAIAEAVKNGLLVITGGPGTGKTTTINGIIRYFEMEGLDIYLAAPTGRAAKRMTEATGYEAKTIHRMLELTGAPEEKSGSIYFERNAQNPLEADVIIIDEMSMVDIFLMHALLSAVVSGTRLILVGDVNQLPSVGPGSVLKDIIASGEFPVVELVKIFRQASQSDIVVNAHKINQGVPVSLDNKSMDFFFLKRYDANVIISVVITLIQKKMPKFVDAEPYDIQVLTPMRKGLLGVERLNVILQQYLNPPSKEKKEKEHGKGLFREGDKVMQIKNNYQLEWEIRGLYGIPVEKGVGVFNGDTGIIKEVNTFAETITVEFDERRFVEYSFKQLEELELAYAITIHKAQGSEYPAVIIPLLAGPKMLMNRNLLYTAVTRARKCVTLVGDEKVFAEMENNKMEQSRYTTLDLRIKESH
ncbi:ATP-dependent RecD-like DNA helicase [Blautia hansenii]|uniref:ATP-dependent RecD2 DNA helicase n=1 Tax=Blautia hansenii DSM 20583 TaxID=537007 RepID=C9LCK0_BLAHA|nr:ATP-dependent RecD-like DNA helicase [Blautia hansenii]ASM68765.1 ATP-dependent RecD-like DNA helicase [Blautia hansenii DSM 20583]EEX20129.1 helicase, RecD/TraA family [Blautia hansenii DSM 20583]UWO11353.1 ATP-dependent RecD-like DNA helicase [Blautia hansenii DSM 20583]